MHYFPGVPWDAWPNLPYDLVMDCVNWIAARINPDQD